MKKCILTIFTCLILHTTAAWGETFMQNPEQGRVKKTNVDELYREFNVAPDSTRTKVWWFHGETETTREGITADLEAFHQAGVGGVVYYDQVHGDAKGACPIFSSDWWDALKFSAEEAKRLGLTFEINLSNGFVAGGPWITKKTSMKRLCYSTLTIDGGTTVDTLLPAPTTDEYWEVRTLAFPIPAEIEWEERILVDRTIKTRTDTMLVYDFKTPFTARALTYSENCPQKPATLSMNIPGPPSDSFYGDGFVELPPIGKLEVSDNGTDYRKVCDIPAQYRIHHKVKTISFPATTARYFRLNLHGWNRPDSLSAHALELRKATLSSQAMTDDWEVKAAINSGYVEKSQTPAYSTKEVIDPNRLIDLTHRLQANGRLVWKVPEGKEKWVIMRIAQTSTRGHTKHGRPGQMGLECDKLSKEAATIQWKHFAQVILDTLEHHNLKPMGVVMDSHEMGSQNWTHGYDEEFKTLKGYDLIPYLPALLGYVVESREKSEEVLLHHRQTIAHLVNHRYFATLDTLAMEAGVMFTAQAMGNGQSMTSDNIAAKGSVRRPQGEFWGKHNNGCYDIKEAASAAHIYGRQIASAEAYTDAKYSHSLAYLKRLADYAFAYQLNEFVVCASAYQPWIDKRPGNTANRREYCLNRNNTQWQLSRGFWDYQSRCAYLMRQGTPVIDLCIYLGSEISTKLLAYRLPEIPEGYDWDVCTDDALFHQLSAKEEKLATENGMTYQLLVIERLARLTQEAEQRILELKSQGVKVYDARKQGDYGLKAYLDSINLQPDITYTSNNRPEDRLFFAHRLANGVDIYFLSNHSPSAYTQNLVFRDSQEKIPEYWNPQNGLRYQLEYHRLENGNLEIPFTQESHEAGFIILHTDKSPSPLPYVRTLGKKEKETPLNDCWKVDFLLPSGKKHITMSTLTDWRMLDDDALKHHSGQATYQRTFTTPSQEELKNDKHVYLRLKGLETVSRIWINEQEAGLVWCAPWEVDITDLLHPDGQANKLRIEVANQLTNRMIGDLSLPEEERSTYATTPIVREGDPLLPAGITQGVSIVIR